MEFLSGDEKIIPLSALCGEQVQREVIVPYTVREELDKWEKLSKEQFVANLGDMPQKTDGGVGMDTDEFWSRVERFVRDIVREELGKRDDSVTSHYSNVDFNATGFVEQFSKAFNAEWNKDQYHIKTPSGDK